jgi:hypothetical protein
VFRAGWTSAALALLLIVSLTGKYVVSHHRGRKDDQALANALRQRLSTAGFTTSIERRVTGLVVHGVRASCRLTVRDGEGWPALSLLFQERARPYGPLQYVYRGQASAKPPRMRPIFDRTVHHILGATGLEMARPALLALAATPGCGAAERLFAHVSVSYGTGGG